MEEKGGEWLFRFDSFLALTWVSSSQLAGMAALYMRYGRIVVCRCGGLSCAYGFLLQFEQEESLIPPSCGSAHVATLSVASRCLALLSAFTAWKTALRDRRLGHPGGNRIGGATNKSFIASIAPPYIPLGNLKAIRHQQSSPLACLRSFVATRLATIGG